MYFSEKRGLFEVAAYLRSTGLFEREGWGVFNRGFYGIYS
jgi:hypothetical protein